MDSRRASRRVAYGCWMWCIVILATTGSCFAVLDDHDGPSPKYSLRNAAAAPIEAAVRCSRNNKAARRRILQENDPPLPPLLSDSPSPPPSPAFNTTGTATMRECRVPQVRAPARQRGVGRLAAVSHIFSDCCSHSLRISIPMSSFQSLVCRRLVALYTV
jgi:hypothetical protein